MPAGEIKLTVRHAMTALPAIDRMQKLRGTPGYWMGRIGDYLEPIVRNFSKQRMKIMRDAAKGEDGETILDKDGNPDVPIANRHDAEDKIDALLDVEETLPCAPIFYEDIVAEFKDDKDATRTTFWIEPGVMRHLTRIIVLREG